MNIVHLSFRQFIFLHAVKPTIFVFLTVHSIVPPPLAKSCLRFNMAYFIRVLSWPPVVLRPSREVIECGIKITGEWEALSRETVYREGGREMSLGSTPMGP